MDQYLPMWTIYDHPVDHPNHYVVVENHIDANEIKRSRIWWANSLHEARQMVAVLGGSVALDRSPEDDPVIVESWI